MSSHFTRTWLLLSTCLIIFGLLSPAWAQGGQPSTFGRFKVAVFPFDVNPPPDEGELDLGKLMAEQLLDALFLSRRFDIVDSSSLLRAIETLQLGDNGLTNQAEAAEFGNFTQANTFVSGTISVLGDGSLSISVVFSEVSTLNTLLRVPESADSEQDFPAVARRIVEQALPNFPLIGRVLIIGDDGVFIDLGTDDFLRREDVGRTGDIVRDREIAPNAFVPSIIGSVVVLEVFETVSRVEVQMSGDNELAEGDTVRIQLVGEVEPPVGTGTLRLVGGPVGAEVFIDGRSLGVLAADGLTLTLPPGEIEIEVRAEDRSPGRYTATITRGGNSELRVDLEPLAGALTVTSAPVPATVTLDGEVIGTTPITRLTLPAGEHRLTIAAEGYETLQDTITIVAGQTLERSFDLEALLASVLLSVNIPDHSVSIDGTPHPADEAIALPPGRHRLTVTAQGYLPHEETFDLAPGQQLRLRVTLAAAVGVLVVTTGNPDASVLIDGNRIAASTVELPAGRYDLQIMANGFVPIRETVTVEVGQITRVERSLVPLARLRLLITPADAEVTIDSVAVSQREIELAPGEHTVVVRARGHVEATRRFVLDPGENRDLAVVLDPVMGSVRVTTGGVVADIFLDGELVGQSPRTLELPPGSYELRLEAPGYEPLSRDIMVVAAQPQEIAEQLVLSVARLLLTVTPQDAVVSIDGIVQSERDLSLAPGRYRLTVSADGYETREFSVSLDSGQTLAQEIALLRAMGGLSVDSSPVAASVTLNGEVIGTTPIADLEVSAGEHRLRIEAPGFEPEERTVIVVVGRIRDISVVLTPTAAPTPLPAAVRLTISEEQFEVFVDGVSRGRQTELSLEPGSHTIEVRAPGAVPEIFELALGPGEQVARTIALEPLADSPPADPPPEDPVAEGEYGILRIVSNLPAVRIVLTDPFEQNAATTIDISEQTGEAAVPVGFYDVRASAPQARSIPDFVDIREGETTELFLSFETIDFTIRGGIGNDDGDLELLLFGEYSGRRISGPITITGPAGWNGDQPFVAELGSESVRWFSGIPVIDGSYTASFAATGVGELFTRFEIDTSEYLEPTEGMAAETGNGRTISVSWDSRGGAAGYRISIEDGSGGVIASEETAATSLTVNGLNLELGDSYLACVTAFNWPPAETGLVQQDLYASRACAPVAMPQPQNQTETDDPYPDCPKPPPLRPDPRCPPLQSPDPDPLKRRDEMPPMEVPNDTSSRIEFTARYGPLVARE